MPTDLATARELVGRWRRVEADDLGPYGGLRKEARGVRVFEPLWERQRATVTELRQAPAQSGDVDVRGLPFPRAALKR